MIESNALLTSSASKPVLRTIAALRQRDQLLGAQSQWDAGFVVSIGDTLFGTPKASETFAADELAAAAEWLDQKARELYPKSDYAGGRSEDRGMRQGEP